MRIKFKKIGLSATVSIKQQLVCGILLFYSVEFRVLLVCLWPDIFIVFFKKIYWLIMLLQLSHFPPFTQLHPAHLLPPTFPPYSSCPWVILISSLASTFPTLFLPSPCVFSTYHLCYLFSVPPPPFPLPYWQPSMWSPSLWFCSCSSCLPSLLSFLF